jgi:signal transduction histidine kinase
VDAWLTRMYERHPVGYVLALPLGGAWAAFTLVTAAAVGTGAHYHGLSVGQFGTALVLIGAAVTVTALGILVVARHPLRLLAAASNASGGLAEEAYVAAYELPRRVVTLVVIGVNFLVLPVGVLALLVPVDHVTVSDVVEIFIGGLIATLYAGVLMYALFELALRPIRARFRRYARPNARPSGLASKLLLALFLSPMVVATVVGGSVVDRDTGSLFEVIALSLVATLFGVLTMGLFVEGTVLRPIRDLIRSTRRVGSGDVEARVAVTTDDELGELTTSYNEMVEELRRNAEELRASRARVVTVSDAARRKVEQDLHDGAQQRLVMLNLKLGLVERKLAEDREVAETLLSESRSDLDRALSELRDLAHGIYPAVLSNDGLRAALAEAAAGAPLDTSLECDGTGRYPPELEAAVYFCCLEALQNAGKHAGAGARATIHLEERNGRLSFVVADDGRGFDPSAARDSTGVQNMADRIGALGGELSLDSKPGGGTRVAGSIAVDG